MNKIIYGINTIESLLKNKSNLIIESFIIDDTNIKKNKRISNLVYKLRLKNIPIKNISKIEFKKILNLKSNQKIFIKIKNNENHTSNKNKIINLIKSKKNIFILILENIQDSRNLGACFRCADAVNVDCIFITKNRSSPINETVRKVANGAVDNLLIFKVNNICNIIKLLKDNNIRVVGTSSKSNKTLYNFDLKYPIAIVLGSEHKGIKFLTKSYCDDIITIPTYGNTCSLNISVATGIFLFEIKKQNIFV